MKICMHKKKWKKLIYEFLFFWLKIFKWYQNASLAVHNEMSRMRLLFSICDHFFQFFAQKKHQKSIIYCIRFCFISFTRVSRSCGLWETRQVCYATSNRFMCVDFSENVQRRNFDVSFYPWTCEESMSRQSFSLS